MTDAAPTADDFVSALTRAANRACGDGATASQIKYIASLMIKAGDTPKGIGLCITNTSARLTKAMASRIINDYKGV